MWSYDYYSEYETRPEFDDHEIKLLDAAVYSLTREQQKMIDENSWLDEWYQNFLYYQSEAN